MNTPDDQTKPNTVQLQVLVEALQSLIETLRQLGYTDSFVMDSTTNMPDRDSVKFSAWKSEAGKRLRELQELAHADKPLNLFNLALDGLDVRRIAVGKAKFDETKSQLTKILHSAATIAKDAKSDGGPSVRLTGGKRSSKSLKIFVAHGKRNMAMMARVKEAIVIAGHEPMVATEITGTARPISGKVLRLMRACDAAIVCVSNDGDIDEKTHQLNSNVLIEIGAALALYPTKFVLLWQKGLQPPSDIEGLERFEVDGEDMKLEDGFRLIRLLQDEAKWAEVAED